MTNLDLAGRGVDNTVKFFLGPAMHNVQRAAEMIEQLMAFVRKEEYVKFKVLEVSSQVHNIVDLGRKTFDSEIAIS